MPATVTVKYLGDEKIEGQIRERLEEELKEYDSSWRVSVLGSAWNDIWEIKVVGSGYGQEHSVKKLDGHQTVEKLVEEAVHMVKVADRNEQAS